MNDTKKYDEIPELSDRQALLRQKDEYTYIVNAEKYQKTGELEVKRVMKKDLQPEASASYVFFKREGCQGYPLKEQDLYIKDASGKYVGPFQMDGNACNTFLKHIKETHPQWAKYAKGTGTTGYINFVKQCPDKEELLKTVEDYALSDYFNNRVGKPDLLAEKLAAHFEKYDAQNSPNATRLPLHVIASLPTGVIARGNGNKFKNKIPTLNENNIDAYCKTWISDPTNGVPAYNKLKKIDYLTPEIIAQYQTMNLTGADNLQKQYQTLVEQQEAKKENLHNMQMKISVAEQLKTTIATAPNLPDFPELYGRKKKMDAKVEQREAKKKLKEKTQETTQKVSPSQTTAKQTIIMPNTFDRGR